MEANFIAEGAVRIPCGAIAFKISTNANLSGQSPSILLRKTALPLKSPTGAFIAAQTRTFRKVQDGEDLFPMKIFTAPQHTRFVLPPFHPTKSIAMLHGRYFSFTGNAP